MTPSDLRQRNRVRILSEIRRDPGISRRGLSELTGLTDASVSRITRDLIGDGLIVETETAGSHARRGRPNVGLFLNPSGIAVLCLCLSAYEQKFSVVMLNGTRLLEGELAALTERGAADIAAGIRARIGRHGVHPQIEAPRLAGIAIAVSGTAKDGVGELTAALEEGFGVAGHVEDISNALHIAETKYREGGRAASRSLLIHAGLELGASLMMNGVASSIAHQSLGRVVVDRSGGDAGWTRLEDRASGSAIMQRLGHTGVPRSPQAGLISGLPHAIRQANSGDPAAMLAFRDAGHALAVSTVPVCAMVRTEQVVLAGPLAAAGPFVQGFQEVIAASFEAADESRPRVVRSVKSYLKGAEAMGLDRFAFSPPG